MVPLKLSPDIRDSHLSELLNAVCIVYVTISPSISVRITPSALAPSAIIAARLLFLSFSLVISDVNSRTPIRSILTNLNLTISTSGSLKLI